VGIATGWALGASSEKKIADQEMAHFKKILVNRLNSIYNFSDSIKLKNDIINDNIQYKIDREVSTIDIMKSIYNLSS
jgi:hypothetical protein